MNEVEERAARIKVLFAQNDVKFADCVEAFATDNNNPHVAIARNEYHRDGEIEIDDRVVVSESDHGAYVMAWIWVDTPDGVDEEEDDAEAR
jgi:hypothetical protein